MDNLYLAIPLLPLAGAIVAGLFGNQVGRAGAHWVTILGVAASFLLSLVAFNHVVFGDAPVSEYKERARQARFLQYRGFTMAQIQDALASIEKAS